MQYVSFFWWIHKIECHWHLYQLCWLELNKQMLLNISTLIYFIYIEYCIVHRRKTSSSLDKDCFGIESLLITDRISGSGDLMEGFTISPHNDPCDGALKLFNKKFSESFWKISHKIMCSAIILDIKAPHGVSPVDIACVFIFPPRSQRMLEY